MTDCSLNCERFYNASLGDRLTVTCTVNSPFRLERQLLYLDDVSYNPDAGSISPNGVHDQTRFLVGSKADQTSMVMSIDSLQPQHYVAYTFSAKCIDTGVTLNHVLTLIETVSGLDYLSVLDYVIFGLFLAVSMVIGIAFSVWAFLKQRQSQTGPTTTDFLLANRSMNFVPLSLSLLSSFMSAVTLIGTPSEVYVYGTMYIVVGFSIVIAIPLAAHVFLPFFYNLGITSVNEYLEKRFSLSMRRVAAFVYLIHMLLYMALVIYSPAIAMQAVSGFNMWASALLSCAVCIIYTSLGGIRATIWTDVFQTGLMVAGVLAVLIQGSYREGGLFDRVWTISKRGDRIDFFNFDPNPLMRQTFWTLLIGGTLARAYTYCINQAQIQRALSASSLRQAQVAYYINIPGLLVLIVLPSLTGLIVYVRYAYCDPKVSGKIDKNDQILPFYVMDVLSKDLPGFPGLFVAMLFSGALSSISSALNGVAAVFVKDFASALLFDRFNFTEARRTLFTRLFTFVFGVLAIILILVVDIFPAVLTLSLSLTSGLGGPVFGIFIIGIFLPFVKWQPGLIALVLSLALNLSLIFGASLVAPKNYDVLQTSIEACPLPNVTLLNETVRVNFAEMSDLERFYSISYMYYSLFGVIGTVAISLLLTPIFGCDDPKRYSGGLASARMIRWTEAIRAACGCSKPDEIEEVAKEAAQNAEESVTSFELFYIRRLSCDPQFAFG